MPLGGSKHVTYVLHNLAHRALIYEFWLTQGASNTMQEQWGMPQAHSEPVLGCIMHVQQQALIQQP